MNTLDEEPAGCGERGLPALNDPRGTVTAETAVVASSWLFLFGLLCAAGHLVAAKISLTNTAFDMARLAAVGEPTSAWAALLHERHPRAQADHREQDGRMIVLLRWDYPLPVLSHSVVLEARGEHPISVHRKALN